MGAFDIKYFLGANSCEGFFSAFKENYNPKNGWRAYIIKGGPGTGKSSFMKFIATKAVDKGMRVELFPCSSDPESLDGLILPERKIAVMDGTAPHVVEPTYAGVSETILNFGQFWDERCLNLKAQNVITVTDKNKALHAAASRYLQAAGQLIYDNYKTAAACTDKIKTQEFAEKLSKRYIPKKGGTGYEWVRFLSGITPKGIVSYSRTLIESCKELVIINDEYGASSDIIMRTIRQRALNEGYEIITMKNAFLPSRLIDHIYIPELSLGFVRECEYQHFDVNNRRIHSRRFINSQKLHKSRERMRFNRKAARELFITAATVLKEAKSVHDILEKHYISEMDFTALTDFANNFCNQLLNE